MGYKALAPVDRFMERQRIAGHCRHRARGARPDCRCSIGCSSISIRSICAARRSSRSRPSSICAATRLSARTSINVLTPNRAGRQGRHRETVQAAGGLARQDHRELRSRRPGAASLPPSASSARILDPVLRPDPSKTPPTDADNVAALKARGRQPDGSRPAAQAGRARMRARKRLADDLDQARRRRRGDARARAQAAMIAPLETALDELRGYLQAQPVTLDEPAAGDQEPNG